MASCAAVLIGDLSSKSFCASLGKGVSRHIQVFYPARLATMKVLKMTKIVWLWVITIGIVIAVGESASFAQFGGRGGIFGGTPRRGRGEDAQTHQSRVANPAPDSYQQAEHNLMPWEVELHLTPAQQGPWRSFEQKVLAYATDFSRERARIGIPVTEGAAYRVAIIDQATDGARGRLAELEDIRSARTHSMPLSRPIKRKSPIHELLQSLRLARALRLAPTAEHRANIHHYLRLGRWFPRSRSRLAR